MRPVITRAVLLAGVALLVSAQQSAAQKLLAEGIKDLASQIAGKVAREQKHKIAVLPFKELSGQRTVLGTYLAEELVTALFESPGLEIVERTMLDKVIGELKLDASGLIDPATAKRVGRIAGVDAIVSGTITDLSSYVAINCRLIDAQTGRIFSAAQTRIAKDDDVRKIMGAAADDGKGETASPSSVAAGKRKQSHPPAPRPHFEKDESGFLFDVRDCFIRGSMLQCDIMITNRMEDRSLTLRASNSWNPASRLIDDAGNEYTSNRGFVAGDHDTSRLVTGVPARAVLLFEKVKPQILKAKLLELVCHDNRSSFNIQFRDVPILRP